MQIGKWFLNVCNHGIHAVILKEQSTIEKSGFDGKFVAMKQVIDALRGLRYKLRMMGIPISSLSYTYVDKMSDVNNTSRPESVLRKKVIQFALTQIVNQLKWVSILVDTYLATRMSQVL